MISRHRGCAVCDPRLEWDSEPISERHAQAHLAERDRPVTWRDLTWVEWLGLLVAAGASVFVIWFLVSAFILAFS